MGFRGDAFNHSVSGRKPLNGIVKPITVISPKVHKMGFRRVLTNLEKTLDKFRKRGILVAD